MRLAKEGVVHPEGWEGPGRQTGCIVSLFFFFFIFEEEEEGETS